jgi:hypothetical protein
MESSLLVTGMEDIKILLQDNDRIDPAKILKKNIEE